MSSPKPRIPPNITYRQFYHWVDRGLVRGLSSKPGRGHERVVDEKTYMVLAAMGKLRSAGFEAGLASVVAHVIVDMIEATSEVYIGVSIGDIELVIDREEFFDGLL